MKLYALFFIVLMVSTTVLACDNQQTANNYPLYVGEVEAIVGLPGKKGDSRALGDLVISNIGDHEITITNISLVKPKDVSMIESFLVKIEQSEGLIGGVIWPLQREPLHWDNRVITVGAVMKPRDERNLVVAVISHAETASIEAIHIEYEDTNGKTYKQNTFVRYFITSRDTREVMEETLSMQNKDMSFKK